MEQINAALNQIHGWCKACIAVDQANSQRCSGCWASEAIKALEEKKERTI